mmetsp:Transcript_17726/g.46513  ORF Transcript_17726/g.46513 Transcript_17726/m.46513 type:complete len:247 (+) Transcript_17726:619-1359(+)
MAQPEARAHEDQRGDVVARLRRREPRAERRARRHAHQDDAVAEGPAHAQRLERIPKKAPGRRLPQQNVAVRRRRRRALLPPPPVAREAVAVQVRAQRPREELRRRRDLLAARGPAVDVDDRKLRRPPEAPRRPGHALRRALRRRLRLADEGLDVLARQRRLEQRPRLGRRRRDGVDGLDEAPADAPQDLARDEHCGDGAGRDQRLALGLEHRSWLRRRSFLSAASECLSFWPPMRRKRRFFYSKMC